MEVRRDAERRLTRDWEHEENQGDEAENDIAVIDRSGLKGRKAQREHYDPRAGKNKSNDRKLVKEGVRSKRKDLGGEIGYSFRDPWSPMTFPVMEKNPGIK
jgi:hypothetical protein